LLKQQRPNVFSMNVANIMPGDDIDIELHYTELLIPTEGVYEFVYPTVVGPRYTNQLEAEAPETDRWIKNPYLKQETEPETKFTINLTISSGMALQELVCITHPTETSWESDTVANITLAEPETFSGDRDFILNYRLAGDEIQSDLLLIEGMAKAGGGEAFVVTKRREAHEPAERYRRYVQSPVLTQIDLEFNGFETYDIEARGFPDLFAQWPVIVFGKWHGQPQGKSSKAVAK